MLGSHPRVGVPSSVHDAAHHAIKTAISSELIDNSLIFGDLPPCGEQALADYVAAITLQACNALDSSVICPDPAGNSRHPRIATRMAEPCGIPSTTSACKEANQCGAHVTIASPTVSDRHAADADWAGTAQWSHGNALSPYKYRQWAAAHGNVTSAAYSNACLQPHHFQCPYSLP